MFRTYITVILFLLTIFIYGCASASYESAKPDKTELAEGYESYRAAEEPVSDTGDFEEPKGEITLREAISAALMMNPGLRSFSWEVRAQEANTLQAGLLPNPVVSTEIEDFAGTGELEGFGSSETTVQLSQVIPLSGRISKRKKVAALNRDLSQWDYETARLDVLTGVTRAFVDTVAAQRRLELAEELLELAENVYRTISVQAEAGEISPIEEKRARVALSQTKIRYERAARELESARKRLAATWGSTDPSFTRVTGKLKGVSEIPSYKELQELLSRNPDIARWATEMSERQATVSLEKSRAIPDITISGGTRWLSGVDDRGFLVGVSVPLVIFDRNQGDILEARYRLVKAQEEKKNVLAQVNSSLAVAYRNLADAFDEIKTLEAEVLPSAESAYKSIFEGYRQGKFNFLDVLDSQRTLFDARFQYLTALADYHTAVAEIERLTATPVQEISSSKPSMKINHRQKRK